MLKIAGERIISDKKGTAAIYALIGVYVALSLSSLLKSGYYSDDIATSVLKGKLDFEHISLFRYIIDNVQWSVKELGRFLPVGNAIGSIVMYYSYNLILYKTTVLLLILTNVFLFGFVLRTFVKDHFFPVLLMGLMPSFFQFRLYCDPILSFGGGLQLIFSFLMLSVIFLQRFLNSGSMKFLFASLLLLNLCLYYHELSIPLVLLHFLLIFQNNRNLKKFLVRSLPFLVSIFMVIAVNVIVRIYFKNPSAVAYGGTTFNLSIVPILNTFLLQSYASLPLSYFISNPSHIFTYDVLGIMRTLAKLDIFAACLLFFLSYISLPQIHYDNIKLKNLFLFGSVLTAIPAMIVSISAKYQVEFAWYGGMGICYIPVYIEYFGTIMILSGIAVLAARLIATNRSNMVTFVVSLGFSILALINMHSNRIIVEKSNIDMYYRRYTLERALANDILKDVPENSTILVRDEYNYDSFPPTVFNGLKKWPYVYDWKNKFFVYLHTKKKFMIVGNIGDIVSPSMVAKNQTTKIVDFTGTDLFYMQIRSYADYEHNFLPKEGYVKISKINNVQVDISNVNNSQINARPVAQYFPGDYFSYGINESIDFNDHHKLTEGWSVIESDHRWSEGTESVITFQIKKVDRTKERCRLVIYGNSNGKQDARVVLNGEYIGTLHMSGEFETSHLTFNSALLNEKGMNSIAISVPNARQPGTGDPRILGISLHRLMITDKI